MTMTLGEALIADDDSASFLKNVSMTDGTDKSKEELDKVRKKFKRGVLNGELKKAFLKALDIALDDILAQAWGGWTELSKYADPEKKQSDAINDVTVSDHTVKSAYEPSVDFVVHGAVLHTFNFEVAAQLDVQGIILKVHGGEITQITLGNLKLGGSVALDEQILLQKDVAQVTMPGVMRLAKPIPILSPHRK
jgi:hypothetical protein